MIDAKDMATRHLQGIKQIGSLEGQELLALQIYCQMFASKTMDEGLHRGAPVEDLMINALRDGIALGLRLQITEGEILGR